MYKPTLTITGCITTVIYLYIFSCNSVEGQPLDLNAIPGNIVKRASSRCSTKHKELPVVGGTACSPNSAVLSNNFRQPNHHNGAKYYASRSVYTTDKAAVDLCKSICGYLVEVDGKDEADFLRHLMDLEKLAGILIAGTDKAKEGTWVYQRSGKTMAFTKWHSGEPNNAGGQKNCIKMLKGDDKMYSMACQSEGRGLNFVCEVN